MSTGTFTYLQTTHDLEMLDKKRQHDFKEYEMEKEFEYQQKLKELPEETRKEEETKHEELKTKHKQHEKINHPVSRHCLLRAFLCALLIMLTHFYKESNSDRGHRPHKNKVHFRSVYHLHIKQAVDNSQAYGDQVLLAVKRLDKD